MTFFNPSVLYSYTLFAIAVICFMKEFICESRIHSVHQVPFWNISWLNFSLVLGGIVSSLMLGSTLHRTITFLFPNILHNKAWNVLALGYSVHGAQLSAIAWMLWEFNQTLGPLNSIILPWKLILKKGFWYFLTGLPIIWASSEAWAFALNWLYQKELISQPSLQPLVELYSSYHSLGSTLLFSILSIGIVPWVEEYIFRGFIYRFLKSHFSSTFALITSALIFAFLHYNVLTFLPLFTIGLLLVRAYEATGNLNVCIVFHSLFNLNTLILLHFNSKIA